MVRAAIAEVLEVSDVRGRHIGEDVVYTTVYDSAEDVIQFCLQLPRSRGVGIGVEIPNDDNRIVWLPVLSNGP